MVPLASNHFWSSVARRSTGSLEGCSRLVHVAEAKVDYLESQIVVEKKVLRLQVSVAHATLVDVLDAGDQFKVKLAGLLLRQPGVPNDIVEQLSAVAVFHYHIEFFFSFNYFV